MLVRFFVFHAFWQFDDEIHWNILKIFFWNRQWIQQFLFCVSINFYAFAKMTSFDVLIDNVRHFKSIIITNDTIVCYFFFNVFFYERIVSEFYQCWVNFLVLWHINFVFDSKKNIAYFTFVELQFHFDFNDVQWHAFFIWSFRFYQTLKYDIVEINCFD